MSGPPARLEDVKMREVHLTTPVSDAAIASLELGDVVYVSGVLYTAREGVYRNVVERGVPMPPGVRETTNVNFHCSPAAAIRPDGTYAVQAVTATASFRFGKSMSRWFERSGAKVVVGKAGLTELAYREWFVPHGAVYLTTVGYGMGAAYGRCITRVVDVHWLEALGIAQALWVLEVERLGPFLVEGTGRDGASSRWRIGRSTCGSRRSTAGCRRTRWAASARPPPAPTKSCSPPLRHCHAPERCISTSTRPPGSSARRSSPRIHTVLTSRPAATPTMAADVRELDLDHGGVEGDKMMTQDDKTMEKKE